MPVNYVVRAEVVDIRNDTPGAADHFLVDTNVWLWVAYPRIGGRPPQSTSYPSYLSRAHRAGAQLRYSPLSFAELASFCRW